MSTLFDTPPTTAPDDDLMPWEIEDVAATAPPQTEFPAQPEQFSTENSTQCLKNHFDIPTGSQCPRCGKVIERDSTGKEIDPPEAEAGIPASDPATTVVTPAPAVEDPKFSGLSEGVRSKIKTNIFEKALCLAVTITKPGNSKKLSSSAIEVESDKDRIRVNKVLMESETFKAIKSLDGEIRNWLYSRCSPCSILKAGIHLIPIPSVDAAEEKLAEFLARRLELIERFCGEYEDIKAASKTALGVNYDPGDYPPLAQMRKEFVFEWSYVSIGTPTALGGVSKALYDRERSKAEAKLADAAETVQQALRVAMADLVDRAVDRLGGTTATGRKKGFGPATAEKITEFLDTFQARNLTGDDEMEALVAKGKDLLRGVDIKALKKDESLQKTIQTGFEEIKASLDGMITERPTRAFALEEEDE